MKLRFVILFTTLCSSLSAQLLFKLTTNSLTVFSFSGGDEFNQPKLDLDYWKGPWTKINMSQNFRYNDDNVILEDGLVNFVMRKKDSIYTIQPHEIDSSFLKQEKINIVDGKYLLNYSAGMIISKQKFHYGLYELRFKVEEGKGVWPAFWFYGGNKNEEIDAFELKNERNNEIHVDTHCPSGCDKGYKNKLGMNTSWGGWMGVSDYLHNGFNIMFLEWKPEGILWQINGYPLAYFKGSFPNPMSLFLNTQIAANGRAFKPGPDNSTIFPNNFYVDYIRMWKNDTGKVAPLQLRANDNMSVSSKFEANYGIKANKKRNLMYVKNVFENEEGIITVSLSKDNILTVKALGRVSNPSTSVSLIGKFGTYKINEFNKEVQIQLNALEKDLELLVKTKSKEVHQQFNIVRH